MKFSTLTSTFLIAAFFQASLVLAGANIYDLPLKTFDGKDTNLSAYKGKVLLIVNTASKCGFTPQLKDLQDLQTQYGPKGFSVLAFPSNDFKQDPENMEQIQKFMSENYQVNFPVFDKISVSGKDKHPLYKNLTEQKSGVLFREVQWNFEKFLVGRDGKVIDRWGSMTKPSSKTLTDKIEMALK